MAGVAKVFFCCFLLYSLFPLSFSLTSRSVSGGVTALWDSYLVGMSLILEFGGERVTPTRPNFLTLFAPSDAVLESDGQPSLSDLHLQFVPLRLPLKNLRSLPDGTKIPTLNPSRFLIATYSPSNHSLSVNGVRIDGLDRIYDDGTLLIFKVGRLFDPNAPSQSQGNPPCTVPYNRGFVDARDGYLFKPASQALRQHRMYSVMASFLDMQMGRMGGEALLTLFAPTDIAFKNHLGRFQSFPSLFLSHFVPCRITGGDLDGLGNGTRLQTYRLGFKINATRDADEVRINGVPIVDRDIVTSDWLVVHGIAGIVTQVETGGGDGGLGPSRLSLFFLVILLAILIDSC